APTGSVFRRAASTSSGDGLDICPFPPTCRPSTSTVNSPRLPSTSSTWTPGSFLRAAAKLAACSRVPGQTGHWRITTFFMIDAPFIRSKGFDTALFVVGAVLVPMRRNLQRTAEVAARLRGAGLPYLDERQQPFTLVLRWYGDIVPGEKSV